MFIICHKMVERSMESFSSAASHREGPKFVAGSRGCPISRVNNQLTNEWMSIVTYYFIREEKERSNIKSVK